MDAPRDEPEAPEAPEATAPEPATLLTSGTEDLNATLVCVSTDQQDSVGVLRLRGLPFSASVDDVQQFFEDYELRDTYVCKREGKL
jgi:hypothetical protein